MPMTFRLHRLATVAVVATLVLGAAACSDTPDPVEPVLGLAEADTVEGFIAPGATSNSFGFAANRTGRVYVRVCGSTTANLDAAVITNSRTVSDVRVADTLQKAGAATTGCESTAVDVVAGQTYRVVVSTVQGFGPYTACYAYTESACSGLAALDYYGAITAELRDAALIQALGTLTRSGQQTFAYDSARGWLYQSVDDPDSNNVITDIYVGRSANVVRRSIPATPNDDATDANFNAEHIWPQSCGANVEASTAAPNGARGDLHNLITSDGPANSARSNNPFGIVTGTPTFTTTPPTGVTEVSRRGPGAGGVTFFEPRASRRGDIARAIFYFYVRYAVTNPDSVSLANFNREEATLRQWAAADPVDDFERARNEVVYLVQRNRNPFIDQPELLARIPDFPDVLPGARATCNF